MSQFIASELAVPGDEREEHRGRGVRADVADGAAAAGAPGPRGGPPRAPRAEDERRRREKGRPPRRRGQAIQVGMVGPLVLGIGLGHFFAGSPE